MTHHLSATDSSYYQGAYVPRGRKGGSSNPRTPVEAPDSLVSVEQARIIDLIGEGEIVGLINGAASIYLDEAPATSYSSFAWDARVGTQDQPYLKGFPSVESNIAVGTTLSSSVPYLRAVSNTTVSGLRINFALGRFTKTNTSNGDISGTRVDFEIDLAQGVSGEFETVYKSAFSGKTTSGYTRSVRIDFPQPAPAGGVRVRVRRTTPDNDGDSSISDVVTIQSVTEIIDYKFRYPNSALVAMQFDAEVFGGKVPKRSYHIRGRVVKVPVNYDPETRVYTGIWNGDFKPAWTNNPAWIYYDLVLNDRFGLGDRISANQVDKWGLYQIGQYCDQLVDDGKGGQEPRMTCNMYLQSKADALKVLQDVAAVFRGITYWGLGQAIVSADMPSDPVYTYTNANVLNGRFDRRGSKKSTIYSVVLSAWNDPSDFYRPKYEYVQDDELVAKFGVRSTTLANIGCSSQGQAHRAAKWALLSNRYETNTVTFGVGLEGIKALPGQVIRVVDQHRQGRRVGGRVRDGSTTSVIRVDLLPNIAVQTGDQLVLNMPTGVSEVRTISSIDLDSNTVTVSAPFSALPVKGGIWAYEAQDLKSELYRIISISEGDSPLTYTITALTYTEGKHGAVDFGTIISDRPTVSIPTSVVPAPQNLRMSSDWLVDQYQAVTTMTIAWDKVEGAVKYDVEWKRDEGDWVYGGRISTTELNVIGIYAGSYRARVRAMNSLNVLSPWAEIGPQDLLGKTTPPPVPVNVRTTSEVFAIKLDWGFPDGAQDTAFSEIQMSSTADGAVTIDLGMQAYPTSTYRHSGMAAGVVRYFRVRLRDKTGNVGNWSPWTYGISSIDANEILDYLTGKITETQLGQDLLTEIEKISGDGPGSVNERYKAGDTLLQSQINSLQSQISDLAGAPDWEPTEAYLAGSIVKMDGKLYRALQDVPAGTPVTNTAYWEYMGDYSSLGDMVAALAVRVDGVETSVEEINGELTAMATRILGVEAAVAPRMAGATNWRAGETGSYAGAWSVYAAFAQSDMAIAKTVTEVKAQVDNNLARVVLEVEALTDQTSALAQTTAELDASLDNTNANVQQVSQALADETQTRAQQTNTLTVDLNNTKVSVQQNASAIATTDGKLNAMYSIKVGIDSNGRYYSAGMGIGVENTPSGMQSQVIFLADRFAVMQSINGVPQAMFAIENGQTVIASAFISKLAVQNAIVGGYLQSSQQSNWGTPIMAQDFASGVIATYHPTMANTYTVMNRNGITVVINGVVRVRMGTW